MLFSIFAGAALKSAAVLGAAWMAALLLSRRSAAARHLVWTVGFAALLALPFLSLSLPALRLPMPSGWASVEVAFQTSASATAGGQTSRSPGQASTAAASPSASWSPDWRLALMLLWAAGSVAALARMLAGWTFIVRLKRQSKPLPGMDAAAAARTLGISHDVDLLETEPGAMPMTFGLLRPAVLMPRDAAEWSEERRRMVLLHELAHVRRGDLATHILGRTALSLYWWNPLAWTAWREFLKERERAADDLVLSSGAGASAYAGHLLEIARTMQTPPAAGSAALAMARNSQLEGRLKAILDGRVNRNTPGRASAWIAMLTAIVVVAPLAALRAQETAQTEPARQDATIEKAIAQKNPAALEDAARAAARRNDYETARKLLDSALAIRGEKSGQQSLEYGLGLLKLGNLEGQRGNTGEAAEFYTKVLSVLGNRREAAPALIHLGTMALATRDFGRALGYFQRAKLADPGKAAAALMWMAVTNQRQNNMTDAAFLFRQAVAAEDPDPIQAATILEVYSQFLAREGAEDEAASMHDRAAALRKSMAQVPNAKPNVYRMGNGVMAPVLLSKVEPQYTDEARAALLAGTVVVYADIGEDGVARNLTVTRGIGLGLDEKAIEAISQWRFRPGMKDGQPVTVGANIEVNFRLM